MSDIATEAVDPPTEEWRTYDEFAAGIDTYRLPNVSLAGTQLHVRGDDGSVLDLVFGVDRVTWSAVGTLVSAESATDPYDAVAVRDDVVFVNLPLESRERTALTLVFSTATHRAIVVRSHIGADGDEGSPQVTQEFVAAVTGAGAPVRDAPRPEPRPHRQAQRLSLQPSAPLRARLPVEPAVLLAVPRGRAARARRHGPVDGLEVRGRPLPVLLPRVPDRGGQRVAARPRLPAAHDRDLPRPQRRRRRRALRAPAATSTRSGSVDYPDVQPI